MNSLLLKVCASTSIERKNIISRNEIDLQRIAKASISTGKTRSSRKPVKSGISHENYKPEQKNAVKDAAGRFDARRTAAEGDEDGLGQRKECEGSDWKLVCKKNAADVNKGGAEAGTEEMDEWMVGKVVPTSASIVGINTEGSVDRGGARCGMCGGAGHLGWECPARLYGCFKEACPGFDEDGKRVEGCWEGGDAIGESTRRAWVAYVERHYAPALRALAESADCALEEAEGSGGSARGATGDGGGGVLGDDGVAAAVGRTGGARQDGAEEEEAEMDMDAEAVGGGCMQEGARQQAADTGDGVGGECGGDTRKVEKDGGAFWAGFGAVVGGAMCSAVGAGRQDGAEDGARRWDGGRREAGGDEDGLEEGRAAGAGGGCEGSNAGTVCEASAGGGEGAEADRGGALGGTEEMDEWMVGKVVPTSASIVGINTEGSVDRGGARCGMCGGAGHLGWECPARLYGCFKEACPGFDEDGKRVEGCWEGGDAIGESTRRAWVAYVERHYAPALRALAESADCALEEAEGSGGSARGAADDLEIVVASEGAVCLNLALFL